MRELFGAGFFVVAAFGGFMATQGGFNLGQASAGFNYDTASQQERQAWLDAQIDPIKRRLKWSLPSGGSPMQPSFSVGRISANAARRAITVEIKIKGRYQIDHSQVPQAKKALTEQLCPGYAKSTAGRNGIALHHKFIGKKGREAMNITVSPSVCRLST